MINRWLIIVSIFPVVGSVVDYLIFKKCFNFFYEYKQNKLRAKDFEYHFIQSINLTQWIFSLFIFSIINWILFVNKTTKIIGNLFGVDDPLLLTDIPLYFNSLLIALLITIYLTMLIIDWKLKKQIVAKFQLKNKDVYKYIFLPWLLTKSMYENQKFVKFDLTIN
ncbi:hypothetical protein [Mycoplasma sp. E35C]|uniref:hypothetical protein n=1 Tax=Mycoplasma sp. E35C TaxID=2801918 RepID=UPI001CA42F52|nr:hypothetical protein [Mycoplasma sp. E35C]QZX49230.1 hypothetical protein JJE79_00440 [Mycoplasma sp. E35C]